MHAARRRGVLGVVRCGTSPSRVRACASPSNMFFAAVIKVTYTRLKPNKDMMDALVHLRKKTGAGGGGSNRRRASPGDIAVGHALH